jgi:glycerate-2-kinase
VRFDPGVLANDPDRRAVILEVFEAALAAIDPVAATAAALRSMQLETPGRILLLGLGKAALGMAVGAAEGLGEVSGVVVTPDPGPGPDGVEVVAGEHPVPGPGSLTGGLRLLEVAESATTSDLVVACISGGGSACAEVPAGRLTPADLAATTRILLRSGAPITEINTVRRHLSRLKGGRLARAAAPARLVTLIVSDVAGGGIEDVAGGPTVPDPTTPADALQVLGDRGLLADLPPVVIDHLGSTDEALLPMAGGPIYVVADGALAAEGARDAAARRGIEAVVLTTRLEGEAAAVGRDMADRGRDGAAPMLIASGETTVRVEGTGSGGRNQELALAAGIGLDGTDRVVVASLGTDGIDGPTGAAGGIGDGGTVRRGKRLGADASAALRNNDSHTYLTATRDVLATGPTGTNVGDLVVVYRSGV